MSALLGRKIGMTGVFTEEGAYMPCTLVEVGPCTVIQVKSHEADGYEALQLGFGTRRENQINKPQSGHFAKVGNVTPRILREFRTFNTSDFKPGDVIKIEDVFEVGDRVHVSGVSRGHGFQGVMKRHHFGGVGMQTHGQSNRERAPGSVGQSSYPSRVLPGTRMGGRMGGKRATNRNIHILAVIPESNILVLKGSIPGPKNTIVEIAKG